MGLQDEIGLTRGKIRKKDYAREKATEGQWGMMDLAIQGFMQRYPLVWSQFIADTERERDFQNPYAEGREESGKKMRSEFRKTCVLPVVLNAEGEAVDGLYNLFEKIVPGLFHKDSINYVTFLKRYPFFSPSFKLNV